MTDHEFVLAFLVLLLGVELVYQWARARHWKAAAWRFWRAAARVKGE